MTRRLAASLMIVTFVAQLGAAETAWQRFRGPNGTGIATDKDIPLHWTEKEGLLWKAPIPGDGNSSPVIWGNKIFLQSARENERVLFCLSTEDGKVLWSQSVPGTKAVIHKLNSLASSTPATDGEKVYTLFWNGETVSAHAFDLAGKPVWKQDLGEFKSQHGYGASPIVYKGLVYVNNDQDGKAALVALDARDGHIVWEKERKAFRACYSTPFILEQDGKPTELIVTSTAGIAAHDPKTGQEIWHWTWKFDGMTLRTVASSVYSKGMIFASSGDGRGDRHAVGIKKGDKGDVTRTNLVWENKKDLPYVPCMIPWGDHLYFTNDKGMAGCVEAKTGKLVYFQRLAPGNLYASPVLIDGKIYAISEKGDVLVFPADPMFRLLARTPLGEPVIASPAVAGGRLYIRGAAHLFCIGSK